MGTNGLTVVISKEKVKVAQYGQFDHYPTGQGSDIINLLQRIKNDIQMPNFKKRVNKLKWIKKADLLMIENVPDWNINFPYLSRATGGSVIELIAYDTLTKMERMSGVESITRVPEILGLINNLEFAIDGLYCEWAYVVDLDKEVLEIYQGFNKEPLGEDSRFFDVEQKVLAKNQKLREKGVFIGGRGYYGPKLVASYSFDNLPTDDDLEILELDLKDA